MSIAKLQEALKRLPPARHKTTDGEFDIMKSDLMNWLVCIPEVRQLLFDELRRRNLIAFSHADGLWRPGSGDLPKAAPPAMTPKVSARTNAATSDDLRSVFPDGTPAGQSFAMLCRRTHMRFPMTQRHFHALLQDLVSRGLALQTEHPSGGFLYQIKPLEKTLDV